MGARSEEDDGGGVWLTWCRAVHAPMTVESFVLFFELMGIGLLIRSHGTLCTQYDRLLHGYWHDNVVSLSVCLSVCR